MKPIAIAADRLKMNANDARELAPTVLAGLAAILHRQNDRAELVLGYVSQDAPGPVPVRLSVGDDPAFAELLTRVREAIGEPASAGNGVSEFDAVVAVDRDPPEGGVYPMWLAAHNHSDGLHLVLHANGGGPDPAAGQRLLSHLRTLLGATPGENGQPISALPILTELELNELLSNWNQTAAPFPNRCLHELLSDRAQETPAAVAVQCGAESLTFAELDKRSNQLARYLRELGVGPEVLVGVSVERSAEMVVGLLGILKAGGAYVPVDPAYPAERQRFMLESSHASVVLTQARLLEELPVDGGTVVCLDRDWPSIAEQPSESPSVECSPEQLAYVIYTSGSTGQPKGVQISHRAVVNFLVTMADEPGLSADDVLVAVTTLSFDIAGLELYLPLLVGARVVVAGAQVVSDPRGLAQLLASSAATVMQATPTTWRMLLDSGWEPEVRLKALCGGEPLPVALADRLLEVGVELWNMYGPTETTIWSTCSRVSTKGKTLTIGRPIANTTLYILDKHMQPVPVGVAGELWIGGAGLARGYRGRADLTAERFVPHPFDNSPGARIYRTGDLARYRPDGQVEFLGRIDTQVKVRGFRIELGEIETVLTRHPDVAEAVVVARGASAEAELAAYVIPKHDTIPPRGLRRFAGETLPGYMVPSTVTILYEFPLTPNGKVDRKALPEPARARSVERDYVAPRTELEQRLAAIWERELDLTPIGVTDDFFDLGATSYAAAGVFAAIERELGGRLPLGALFSASTVEALAQMLERGAENHRWKSLIPLQPEGARTPIFCVHGGAGTIIHLAPLARRLDDQPFYGLQSPGLYGGTAPARTVEAMASLYLSEMRQIHPGGPWRLGGYCFGAIVAFEMAQRLVSLGEEVELLAIFNGPSPAWIKEYDGYRNQATWRANHGLTAPQDHDTRRLERAAADSKRRRDGLTGVLRRLHRVPAKLLSPRRFVGSLRWAVRHVAWLTRIRRARLLLAFRRPLPEWLREEYFFVLHKQAERAYEPKPYPGAMLIFYGEGLYEDPTLGWDGLAEAGIECIPVAGADGNNREAMQEPAVGLVAERLQEHLDGLAAGRTSKAA